jgi:PleD family two-component response regulator
MCGNQGKAANDKVQGPGKGLHILVAEDNIVNQRVAVTLLQKWGHTTVLACNGAEAVEKSAKENFDLILMDVCTSLNYLISDPLSAKSAYIFVTISCL